eukprot:1184969-Prorocentrum_minimum.AAC.1
MTTLPPNAPLAPFSPPQQLQRMQTAASMGLPLAMQGGTPLGKSSSAAALADSGGTPGTPGQALVLAAPGRGDHTTPEASRGSPLQMEGLTLTSLYTKYAETADALRRETAERRRQEKVIDEIFRYAQILRP